MNVVDEDEGLIISSSSPSASSFEDFSSSPSPASFPFDEEDAEAADDEDIAVPEDAADVEELLFLP